MKRLGRAFRFSAWPLVAVLFILIPNKYYLSIAVLTGFNALLAISLNLLLGLGGQVSLGHAAFYGLGAYGAGILAVRAGWPSWLCLPAALAPHGGGRLRHRPADPAAQGALPGAGHPRFRHHRPDPPGGDPIPDRRAVRTDWHPVLAVGSV